MKTCYITRRETFNAAHKLYREDWSDEKNIEVYGKCSNKNWHGHNFTIFVTVKGIPNPETGFIIDLLQLKNVVQKNVLNILDHSQFDVEVDWFKDKQPSSENLVIFIWEQIVKEFDSNKLHRIRLHETPTIFTDYYGPG